MPSSKKAIIHTIEGLRKHLEAKAVDRTVTIAGICGIAGAGKTTYADNSRNLRILTLSI